MPGLPGEQAEEQAVQAVVTYIREGEKEEKRNLPR